ncbi:MAG: hypothetical protein H6840_12480 [Planctomycetes bacterium]|nr:hypothetical protein [Planctomycetota bacterium]
MPTKKQSRKPAKRTNDDIRPEYDFSQAVPNKYAEKFREGVHYVPIEPELVEFFGSAESINDALRALAGMLKSTSRKKRA